LFDEFRATAIEYGLIADGIARLYKLTSINTSLK
jgi:Flp pilus assembly pilin Flp